MSRTPPYEQIADHFRSTIRSGHLPPGDELPSTRRLAEQWGVAPSTAQRALELLRDEGWIQTRPGRPPVAGSPPWPG